MIVIVDERELVKEGYHSLFDREGVASAGFGSSEFGEWMTSAADEDLKSVRAFLIGDCGPDAISPRKIRDRTGAPVIALSEQHSLENTLQAVRVRRRRRRPQAGPHPRDTGPHLGDPPPRQGDVATTSRSAPCASSWMAAIPRSTGSRCRCRAASAASSNIWRPTRGRRVTKTQVFNAIYGIFDDEVEENVVESHISKLRKKLRDRLGYDPIDSKRFLGYRLIVG